MLFIYCSIWFTKNVRFSHLHSWGILVAFLNAFIWFCHKGRVRPNQWVGKCSSFISWKSLLRIRMLVFCCCITNYHKLHSLWQHKIISSVSASSESGCGLSWVPCSPSHKCIQSVSLSLRTADRIQFLVTDCST